MHSFCSFDVHSKYEAFYTGGKVQVKLFNSFLIITEADVLLAKQRKFYGPPSEITKILSIYDYIMYMYACNYSTVERGW